MAEDRYNGWEVIRPLGEGGQSTVFLARSPSRTVNRKMAMLRVGELISGISNPGLLLESISEYLRADAPEELGALKLFDKVRRSGAGPEDRIRREVDILNTGHASLPKLLEGDLNGKWLVTEFFPAGSLDKSPDLFKGDALRALRAFRPLVDTVAHLHSHRIIHRDIKPANVFIGENGKLIIGDFGIAFADEGFTRVTVTHERVGPWDYMPQWADTGERLEDVKPSFDIYMLGKLLWCMISGRLRLPREYHRRPEFDLSRLFPNDRRMNSINSLLDNCIVEHENACIQSATEMLSLIDDTLAMLDRGMIINEKGEMLLPCLVCGKGVYVEETTDGRAELIRKNNRHEQVNPIFLRVFCCNICSHRAFFAPGFPNEAQRRNWTKL